MARLQIVILPSVTVGSISAPEFLIVIDEVGDELLSELCDRPTTFKEATGARGVLVFQCMIEVV